ncbi:hypothetical protein PPACK8108_LOCUS16783 [Phakopsora pachyrhizi]|uniref:Uncharacterized protein n=1 Tax=Phakopsora pachyrhizi TaxID=170000 RepID=A0AAV0BAQ5_PHAPC|nr:hypothetical protein PPACK8108_LOCUS16783 [Phakopsora pachyrhizi]
MITNLRYRGASLTNPFAGFSILTAGTMHIHQWFWPGSFSIVKNAREYLSVDTRILNNLKKTWSISHQWCKVLNTQYALNSLIKDNDSSTTVVTQPLNLIRASLMKIINTQFNVNPGETVKVTARPKFDGTNQVLNLKERVNEVDEIGEGAAVEISDKKMDFSQSSVAEIVRMKHDIFAQAWPEPRLLQDDSHSFVGINHRRQQQEQEHMFRGSSDEVVVARAEGQDSHHWQ